MYWGERLLLGCVPLCFYSLTARPKAPPRSCTAMLMGAYVHQPTINTAIVSPPIAARLNSIPRPKPRTRYFMLYLPYGCRDNRTASYRPYATPQ